MPKRVIWALVVFGILDWDIWALRTLMDFDERSKMS